MAKTKRQVRDAGYEHGTFMLRSTMETPAWRALSSAAKNLYPWLKLEWKGPNNNNNGQIKLSARQAAKRTGINVNTAAKALRDLQAKGFLVVKKPACLGMEGESSSPEYELTELKLRFSDEKEGRKLYRDWSPGNDFPVQKSSANNPAGKNGREKNKTPSQKLGQPNLKVVTDNSEAS